MAADATDAAGGATPIVTLYTRTGCHLCTDAALLLARLAARLGFRIAPQDVDADPALAQRFGFSVPVVAVGERIVAAAPLEAATLEAALRRALAAPPSGSAPPARTAS